MGTVFALVSMVCVLAAFIGLCKPKWVRQTSRLKAFVLGWLWSLTFALIGTAVDGNGLWGGALIFGLFVWGLYGLGLYLWKLWRKTRSNHKERKTKPEELHQAKSALKSYIENTKVESNIVPEQPAQSLTRQDVGGVTDNDERYLPKSYVPEVTRGKARALDKFEASLTTLWAGDTKPVEFTYVNAKEEKTRRKVQVSEVMFNERGAFYLRGFCQVRQEQRTFKVDNIETMLKVGSKRYYFEEWCADVLGLPYDAVDNIRLEMDS